MLKSRLLKKSMLSLVVTLMIAVGLVAGNFIVRSFAATTAVIVQLKGDPVLVAKAAAEARGQNFDAVAYRQQILAQPMIIAMLAVPILIQVYFNSGLAYLLNRLAGEQHCVAAPSALIGASNFFELAVAAAISLFGLHSGAALATVVGVLIEVPVMLSVVKIVNASKGWYEKGLPVSSRSRGA